MPAQVVDLQNQKAESVDIGFSPGERTADIRFRPFAGEQDFDAMSRICIASWKADAVDFIKTAEDFKMAYEHAPDRNPSEEILIAELDGEPIAFAERTLMEKSGRELRCHHYAHVLPEFRLDGLREALTRHNEAALRDMAASRPKHEVEVYHTWANHKANDWRDILLARGYEPIWHLFEMRRPNLDNVPEAPLPEGVIVRPIVEADHRRVWEATKRTFQDQPWSHDDMWTENRYRQWRSSPTFMPHLWQIAWDGDEVAGSVQNYIDHAENEAFGKKRGHTEVIFVAPSWRGKGLAKALIARSLLMLKEMGMEEAMLDTEEANAFEAYKVYQRMGFEIVNQFTFHQKPL